MKPAPCPSGDEAAAPADAPGGWRQLAIAIGPGLVVMLADTESGSVIAAAQGGAEWGYRLILPQLLMIPALFMAQELAARLGLSTRAGLAELVQRRSGRLASCILLATLVASCAGALVTELSGLAGVGQLFGVPVWQSSAVAAAGLIAVVWAGSPRSVELMAIAVGLCELAFIVLAWLAHPSGAEMLAQSMQIPLGDSDYLYLLAANLGTCVIPWAIFYQQSASIGKGYSRGRLTAMRVETLAGAALCQIVTVAIVIAAAAAFAGEAHGPLDRVGDIAKAFSISVGPAAGRIVFALGLSGGALVASIVVCLTAAWAFGEVFGLRHSLGERNARAAWFHAAITVVVMAGAALVATGANLVRLSVGAGVLNALLLPIVFWFLYRTAREELPPALRLRGGYAAAVAIVLILTSGVGVCAAVIGVL